MPGAALYIAALLQLVGVVLSFYIVITGLRDSDRLTVVLGILIGVLIASGLYVFGVVVTFAYATYGILRLRRQKTRNHDRLDT